MSRPLRHLSWSVTTFEGWWWAPSLHAWINVHDKRFGKVSCSNYAHTKTSDRALRVARLCPASEIVFVKHVRDRSRRFPRGYEIEYTLRRAPHERPGVAISTPLPIPSPDPSATPASLVTPCS